MYFSVMHTVAKTVDVPATAAPLDASSCMLYILLFIDGGQVNRTQLNQFCVVSGSRTILAFAHRRR